MGGWDRATHGPWIREWNGRGFPPITGRAWAEVTYPQLIQLSFNPVQSHQYLHFLSCFPEFHIFAFQLLHIISFSL